MESSFLEKLKKGMKVEGVPINQQLGVSERKKSPDSKKRKKSPVSKKEIEIKTTPLDIEDQKEEETEPKKMITKETEPKKSIDPSLVKINNNKVVKKEKWPPESEGQLAIDVYQTESELVIQSAIAGVKPQELDILIEEDLITIKGSRKKPFKEEGDYFTQECYWGAFSRQIILPVEVDPGRVDADLKEGVLTIRIPKIVREKKRKVVVKG